MFAKLTRSRILFLVTLALLLALPETFLLPLKNGTLLAFCVRGKPQGEMEPLQVWALEEENALLKAEVSQLRSALRVEGELHSSLAAAIPARVVYRGLATWDSSLWIGLGEVDGPLVSKGSAVVLGRALVGVVDYVGKRRSRVALITDPHLHPAVEAIKGRMATDSLLAHLEVLQEIISEEKELQENIAIVKNHLGKLRSDVIHASKGELNGAARSLWRTRLKVLDGVGFEGEEPPAVGDLLVTTGLDGVFPAGLEVAHVVEAKKSHRGSPACNVKALPAAGELEGAKTLFVLPPCR